MKIGTWDHLTRTALYVRALYQSTEVGPTVAADYVDMIDALATRRLAAAVDAEISRSANRDHAWRVAAAWVKAADLAASTLAQLRGETP